MYIIFVAPPGKARKSTTAGYAEELLDGVPVVTKGPTIVTQAALLDRLIKSDDASVYLISSEFASLISKSKLEMFEFLTDMFDGRKSIEAATISRGVEFADRPCINLLAATTPGWISENMPESVIGGGFASRVIFIFEDKVRRRQLYYNHVDYDEILQKQMDLTADLVHIATNIEGEYVIEKEAQDFMETWYRENAEYGGGAESYRLHGYFERRPAHAHKVAMLFHLTYSDEMVLNKTDFETAIGFLESIEPRLSNTFKAVGKNKFSVDMDHILNYITQKGRVQRPELLSQFYANAEPDLLERLIKGLIDMGEVRVTVDTSTNNVWYSSTSIPPKLISL